MEVSLGLGNWLHGECVGVGMLAATAISRHMGVLKEPELYARIDRLLQRLGLPTRVPQAVNLTTLTDLMTRDKKSEGGRVNWILPVRAGEVVVTREVPAPAVTMALESLRR
jgi:3-dehydroquinate synthase